MKKLAVLLAAVMAFAFSASAYAANFSDIADQPVNVQDSIAKTVALGIINGYDDGTFGPAQNITRAEFAKIAVTAAGAKDTADMLQNNKSSFKDVKEGWYTGWVNASESLGIFLGDGNGNFRPNDTITNQEVITVLLRLLGYNDNLTGTWPVNYVTQANKCEILDDVAVVAAAPAKRADVVVMLDATLDTNLVTYDKDTNEFVLKQNTKSGSTELPLLEDSFKGAYVEVGSFAKVDEVRDFAKQTLNWTAGKTAMIIDGDTRVSYNGGSLFDLEGHQGNVYYVKDNDKLYARFIEVESYTKTTTTKPTCTDGKVAVNKTKYTVAPGFDADATITALKDKNSNYILYFNDDDQVYDVKSDVEFTEKAAYVKSINSSTMKLTGSLTKSVSLANDILVYTEDGFIDAADLTVGDAVMEIADDLYVKVDEAAGSLTKAQLTGKQVDKITVAGKTYVADEMKTLDKEYEAADAAIEDIYGNEVSFILNKDNSVSAIVVDATSTGTKLYGIVVGGDKTTNGFGSNKTNQKVSIFTEEGKTVTYSYDLDNGYDEMEEAQLGQLVQYKLTKDGEIKNWTAAYDGQLLDADGEIEVKNNSYLVGANTVTLASNVVIFEVDEDDDDIDPSVVTRASLLGGGDFTPGDLTDTKVTAYANYFTNTNGAVKVLAYTTAGTSNYNYGVVDGDVFSNADYDDAIMLDGDENVYEVAGDATNHDLIVYTKSGDKLTVKLAIAEKKAAAVEVTGYTDGLIVLDKAQNVYAFDSTVKDPITANKIESVDSIMTDADTIVYVMNSSTGYFELGDLDSISKGAYVNVVVMDKDGYADLIIVDEYNDYTL